MNPLKVIFIGLGLIYAVIFAWGLGASLPNVPTIGALGIFWCALGWSIVHRTLE